MFLKLAGYIYGRLIWGLQNLQKYLSSGFLKNVKFVGMDQITCKNCNKSSWMQVTKILLTRHRPEQFSSFFVRSFHCGHFSSPSSLAARDVFYVISMEFLSLRRRRPSWRNVPCGEEWGGMAAFAGWDSQCKTSQSPQRGTKCKQKNRLAQLSLVQTSLNL